MDHDDHSRDSSDPPPPHSTSANPVDVARERADHAVGKARIALASADGTAAGLAAARAEVKEVRDLIGNSPDPLLSVPGRGLLGAFSSFSADVHKIGAKVDALVAAAEGRKSFVYRAATMIAGPSIALAVGAVAVWLAGFHR